MADKNIRIVYQVDDKDLLRVKSILGSLQSETKQTSKENTNLKKSVNEVGKESDKSFKSAEKNVDNFGNKVKAQSKGILDLKGALKGVQNAIIGAFAVSKILDLGKAVINTTAEFQKFQAVLKNTLGSQSAADLAFKQITEFASKTPFQVAEITDSYVKLANRGLKPTTAELTKLGDIAASQGKSFNQLTEAFLDATTGEFERLKEFGIRAKQSGDNVVFTFKGVTTTVKKTDDAIKDYLVSLGDLEGVSGSMAAVSETLGGKISNLDDSFDRLFFAIGDGTKGPLAFFISGISTAVNKAAEMIEVINTGALENVALDKAAASFEAFQKLDIKGQQNAINEVVQALQTQRREYEKLEATQKALTGGYKSFNAYVEENNLTHKQGWELLKEINEEAMPFTLVRLKQAEKEYELFTAELKKNNQELANQGSSLGILEKLQKELKETTDLREKSLTEGEVRKHNFRIASIQEEIKRLTELRTKLDEVEAVEGFGISKEGSKEADELREQFNTIFPEFENNSKAATDKFISDVDRRIKKQAEESEKNKAELQKREEDQKAHQEKVAEIRDSAIDATANIVNSIATIQNNQDNARLERLNRQKEQELAVAGENAEARKRIEQDFANKESEIRRRQAERDKRMAIFNAIINTAQAVIKAVAISPATGGLPFSAIAAAVGAAQIAAISSQQIPAFAKGTKSVQGGQKGKDSVLAKLMPEEMVIPVATKRKYEPALNAIFDNRVSPEVMNGIVKGQSMGTSIDYDLLAQKVMEGIKSVPLNVFSFDEKGFTRAMQSKAGKTEYLSKKYSGK